MVPMSTYGLVLGLPVFKICFCILLNVVGKRLFGTQTDENLSGANEKHETKG